MTTEVKETKEVKAVKASYKFEGTQLVVHAEFDTNKDGEPVAELDFRLHIAEIPDEVFSAVKK